jgi:hypothetical protein
MTYINRKEAADAIRMAFVCAETPEEFYEIAHRNIITAKTLTVERCEDCRYYDDFKCLHPCGLKFPQPIDFCSNAWRKE